jgi:nonsense-mediated mRNA decay protein 3
MDEFMDDLEEDKDLRQNINIYKNPDADNESVIEDDDDAPKISLEEMMEDLYIYEDDVMEVYE